MSMPLTGRSLCEINFYLAVCLLIKLRPRLDMFRFGGAWLTALYALQAADAFGFHNLAELKAVAMADYGHLFIAGMMFYDIRADPHSRVSGLGLIAACLLYGFLFQNQVELRLTVLFYALMYLLAVNRLRWLAARPLDWMGAISYTLYLVHQNVGFVIIRSAYQHGVTSPTVAIAAAIVVSMTLATLITVCIEQPILRMIRTTRALSKPSSLEVSEARGSGLAEGPSPSPNSETTRGHDAPQGGRFDRSPSRVLTNWLVNNGARSQEPHRRPVPPGMPCLIPPPPDSRKGGFDGVSVDDIARDAGVNKAMIYYHFADKLALYRAVVARHAEPHWARPSRHRGRSPDRRHELDRFIEAFVSLAETRPWFPPLMLREISEGAPRLDADTLAHMRVVFGASPRFSPTARRAASSARVHPVLAYMSVLGPLMINAARERVARNRRGKNADLPMFVAVSHADLIAHLQETALRMLRASDMTRSSSSSCSSPPPRSAASAATGDRMRVSGHVEATETRLAPEPAAASSRSPSRKAIASSRADRPDARHARRRAGDRAREGRAGAGRRAASPRAGRRAREDIRQAESQIAAARADVSAARAELAGGRAGPRALRDAAQEQLRLAEAARRCGDEAGRGERPRGCRGEPREVRGRDAAPASAPAPGARRSTPRAPGSRRRGADRHPSRRRWATRRSTRRSPGVVTEKLVEVGEVIAPRTPALVVVDLDHAWADVFVPEPAVPRLKIGQSATVFTDAGGAGIAGHHHLHLAEGRVHAAQRADRRGAIEAGLPHPDRRRQQETACSSRACRSKPTMPLAEVSAAGQAMTQSSTR